MSASTAHPPRQRDTIAVHVLRKQLDLSDDAYRDLVADLFDGRRSSTELSDAELARFRQHLQGLQRKQPAARKPGPPLSPTQRKMFSLWQQLADAGLVRHRKLGALQAWIAGHTHVERWEWLNSHQEATVIESLKRWLKRREEPPAAAAPAEAAHG